jgi:hypothetical protein
LILKAKKDFLGWMEEVDYGFRSMKSKVTRR